MGILTSSELNTILASSDNGLILKQAIQAGIPAFRRGLAERGRSAPVLLKDEGFQFVLTRQQLSNLCSWYLDGQLDSVELEYCANLLELSEDFEIEMRLLDELYRLGTPELAGELTPSVVQSIRDRLLGAA